MHKEAIDDYDQTISIKLNFALAYRNRALAKEALKLHEEAAADYSKSTILESEPGDE